MFPGRPRAYSGLGMCKEGEKQPRMKNTYIYSSPLPVTHFLPSLLYYSRGVAGNNFCFSIRSNAKEKARMCGQDEVGEPFMAVSWSPL